VRRFAAPAAFLLAVTVAVLLIRSGLHAGRRHDRTTAAQPAVARHTPTTTTSRTRSHPRRKRPAKRFWTVRAGDTFGVISAATGVPVARLQALNPKLSSTSLFIGEKVRTR
jgi:LysM repeat protein